MSFEKIALIELNPVDYNPRQIGEKELRRLQASVKEHTTSIADWDVSDGYRLATTVTVNRQGGRIVGGHQRVKALQALGQLWVHKDDVSWVDIKPGSAKEKALNISLNNDHASGRFDDSMLQTLVTEISEETDTLFQALDFNSLLDNLAKGNESSGGQTDPDDTPALNETSPAVSKLGEIYQLGNHRLLCGNSCEESTLKHLLGDTKVEMLFTDPPYGVDYDGGVFHSGKPNKNHKRKKLAADENAEVYSKFLPVVLSFVDGPAYMWAANRTAPEALLAVRAANADMHSLIIWHKTNATYAAMNAHYKERHELCLYFKPKGSTLRWCGPSDERTIWEMDRAAKNTWHPTQKPVALAERALKNHEVTTVLDCFAGSGSTIIAAEGLGRVCYAIEIEPRYVDVIRQRYAEFVHGEGCDWEALTPVSEEVMV